jgi:hypothetical protein
VARLDKATADAAANTLVGLLRDTTQQSTAAGAIGQLNNIKELTSGPAVIAQHIEEIVRHKDKAAALVQSLEDFAAGRSLQGVVVRLDELDAKIDALNARVAETCHDFEDVKGALSCRALSDSWTRDVARAQRTWTPTSPRSRRVGDLPALFVLTEPRRTSWARL